jgi:alginate O-acetyltransferase complex protein AlgI
MSVTSVYYIALVLGAAILHGLVPRLGRAPLLLAIGLGFYASFNWRFAFLLVAVIALAYRGAFAVAPKDGAKRPAWRLWAVALAVLAPLVFYKYLIAWFAALRELALPSAGTAAGLDFGGYGEALIPVGLSFFTFQCLGYLIDVARGGQAPSRDPLRFALFVCFFPILLAGPIERHKALARQFDAAARPTAEQVLSGLLFFAYGLAMKVVVGDALGAYVDAVYANAAQQAGPSAVLGLAGFTLQLYADFCGYSLMALGAARLLGIEVTANFRQPFFARSISDFWQRWHISLTRWIGDYVYRPLALKLVKLQGVPSGAKELAAALVTWIAMGLWHGAALTFVVFGGAQALMIFAQARWTRWRRGPAGPARRFAGWALTMAAVVATFGLIRADSLAQYGDLIGAILAFRVDLLPFPDWQPVLAGLVVILAVDAVRVFRPGFVLRHVEGRAALIFLLVLAVLLFGHEQNRAFIYFRF